MLKEVSYKDLKFNPFRLIGDEWMLVTAGNEKDGCNTMTASWAVSDVCGVITIRWRPFTFARRDTRRSLLTKRIISRSLLWINVQEADGLYRLCVGP